jgi:septum formation protein
MVLSVVGFARLSPRQIDSYLATDEWRGKAGGYAIQGTAATFINFLSGSYSGVVGLPLYETSALLTGLGYQ